MYFGQRIHYHGRDAATTLQDRIRLRAAHLVSTASRESGSSGSLQRFYSALRLFKPRAAMLDEQSLAGAVVSNSEGVRNAACGVLRCGRDLQRSDLPS
jgi:hypothetical protein